MKKANNMIRHDDDEDAKQQTEVTQMAKKGKAKGKK